MRIELLLEIVLTVLINSGLRDAEVTPFSSKLPKRQERRTRKSVMADQNVVN